MKKSALVGMLFMMLILPLAGCGGGGSSGGGDAPLAQKTATITFGVMSTATLGGVPINGIHVVAKIPAGVTVATDPANPRVISGGLAGLKTNGSLPFGRYSATTREVVFDVIDTGNQSGIGFGDFARLTTTVMSGTNLSAEQFPLPGYKVSGYDPNAAVNPVDLTGKTKPALKVTFGF